MFIQFAQTPNPNTLKFLPGHEISPVRSYDYRTADDANASPLAQRLFSIEGVAGVFLGHDFISVTKAEEAPWEVVRPLSMAAIMDHLTGDHPIVLETEDAQEVYTGEQAEIVKQIKAVLEQRVKPAVAMDGGDIQFQRFENGVVYLAMRGACAGCPSANITLKAGVQRLLQHFVPEVTEVRAAQMP